MRQPLLNVQNTNSCKTTGRAIEVDNLFEQILVIETTIMSCRDKKKKKKNMFVLFKMVQMDMHHNMQIWIC